MHQNKNTGVWKFVENKWKRVFIIIIITIIITITFFIIYVLFSTP